MALKTLKKWCVLADIKQDVGFYSLRHGTATYIYSLGVVIHDIKVEGDWQFLVMLLYLSSSMSKRVEIDQKHLIRLINDVAIMICLRHSLC